MKQSKIENTAISAKRLDVEEMALALTNIPDAEREKLYYMMKGIELMVEQPPVQTERAG